MTRRARQLAQAVACAALALTLALALLSAGAYADELSDVQAQLEAQVGELTQLGDDLQGSTARISELETQMQALLDEIDATQARHAQLQSDMAVLAETLYKDYEDFNFAFILVQSESIDELFYRLETSGRVLGHYADLARQAREADALLNRQYQEASQNKDEQQRLISDMKEKKVRLEESVADLKQREKLLSVEQQAALAQAAAAMRQVAQTFETGSIGDDGIGWYSGLASAYGGASDASTPNPGITATGTVCDDWSVGVAVPMSWGAGQYYGRRVEISYGGRSIIAPVVDCGYMDAGRRALDLQPGVFKAFGCYTCADWGVREVSYRFL